MKYISTLMVIVGIILCLSAPGNDEVTGGAYPMGRIITLVIVGGLLILGGVLIKKKC